jgi:hypothetical protein
LKIKHKILGTALLAFFLVITLKETSLASDFKIIKVNKKMNRTSLKLSEQNFSQSQGVDKFFREEESLPLERRGEKLFVSWKYNGNEVKDTVTLQIQYRTSKGKEIQKTEKKYQNLKKGKYTYCFEHIGNDFLKKGQIVIWSVSLIEGKTVLAFKNSRLWDQIGTRNFPLS